MTFFPDLVKQWIAESVSDVWTTVTQSVQVFMLCPRLIICILLSFLPMRFEPNAPHFTEKLCIN